MILPMRPKPAWISGVLIVGASLELLAAVRPAVRSTAVQPTVLQLPAPKIEGRSDNWLNTDGQRQSFERGRVYVVEFGTYGCVKCQRNLADYAGWQRLALRSQQQRADRRRLKVQSRVRRMGLLPGRDAGRSGAGLRPSRAQGAPQRSRDPVRGSEARSAYGAAARRDVGRSAFPQFGRCPDPLVRHTAARTSQRCYEK